MRTDQSSTQNFGVSLMDMPQNLEPRALELLVATARRFDSVSSLIAGKSRANAKSLHEVARLHPVGDAPLTLEVSGQNAQQTVDAVRVAWTKSFGA